MKDYTHITLVVDRSGSMNSMRADAEGGVNTFIKAQAEEPGKCTLLLKEFDTDHTTVYGPGNIDYAPGYALHPRGGTALRDAVGYAIADTMAFGKSLSADEQPDKVIIVVMTDGGENSSTVWSDAGIRAKQEEREGAGWKFLFLASGIEAVSTMAHTFTTANSMHTNSAQGGGLMTRTLYASASNTVSNYRNNNVAAAGAVDLDEEAEGVLPTIA